MRKLKIFAVVSIILCLALVLSVHFSQTVKTQIISTGRIKVEEVLHAQINRTCQRIVSESDAEYIERKQMDSAVTQIGVNAPNLATLATQCNVECANDLKAFEHLTIDIPRGSLFGSTYLADKGPRQTFNLRVSYELKCDHSTLFESVGINQIRYAVYLVVIATAHVAVPASVGDATYTYYVPVCETIYSADVPNVYVANEDGTKYLDLLP